MAKIKLYNAYGASETGLLTPIYSLTNRDLYKD
jgi:hypothetical protein